MNNGLSCVAITLCSPFGIALTLPALMIQKRKRLNVGDAQ